MYPWCSLRSPGRWVLVFYLFVEIKGHRRQSGCGRLVFYFPVEGFEEGEVSDSSVRRPRGGFRDSFGKRCQVPG